MRLHYLCLLAFVLFFSTTLNAQDFFLKIEGPRGPIEGESMQQEYPKQVEILSFAQATSSNCGPIGAGGACKPITGNFFLVMYLDKSLNPLRKVMYSGERLQRLDLSFVRQLGSPKPQLYYSVRLDEVTIVSINESASVGDRATIQIEFAPSKVGWTHLPIGSDGRPGKEVKFGWDIVRNMEWTSF